MTTLSLGGVVFQDFEVPEQINFGGEQALAVHRLPGGTRVIDSLGPDDADIRWSGRFRGPTAEERAILLDFMRRSGSPQLLSWSFHFYQVVIKEFTGDFRQSYEIPYSISCTVITDLTQALIQAAVGFIDAIAGDLLNAVGLGGVIGIPAINTALTGVAAALTNYQAGVPTSTNLITAGSAVATGPLLSALQTSIGGAQTATQTAIGSANGQFTANSTPAAGTSPAVAATALSNQTSAMTQLGQLYQLGGLLNRMNTNTGTMIANGSTVLQ